MEKLTVFYYSCLEFEDDTGRVLLHHGLTADTDVEGVRHDMEGNYIDPQHINIVAVPELAPTFDEEGLVVGFMRRRDRAAVGKVNAQGWTGSRAVLLWKRYCGHCVSKVVELARQVSSGERDPELINKQLNAWAAESENENPE